VRSAFSRRVREPTAPYAPASEHAVENFGKLLWPRDCSPWGRKRREERMKYAIPMLVLLAGVLVSSTLSYAKPEYTKKEKKGCTYCHVTAKSKELNDAGKYYKDHDHSLEGYQPKT
jgi:hypothetical protein